MSLGDIVGQKRAVSILRGVIRRKRVASSYLFCGEEGIGKKKTAVNFAKALNCLGMEQTEKSGPSFFYLPEEVDTGGAETSEPEDACDVCSSCVKIISGSHPDVIIVSPEEGQIKIDDIRRIDEALSYRPFEGRRKVVIVDAADTMNISAANAFLKTLEEPPPESVIILVSSRPGMLPATIRSRCCRIGFFALPVDACAGLLKDSVADDKLGLVAAMSMGCPGTAMNADLLEERAWFVSLFGGMLKGEGDGWESREVMERWLDLLVIALRDMAVLGVSGDQRRLINSDLAGWYRQIGKSKDVKAIIQLYEDFSLIRRHLQFNLNKSITWNYTASRLRKDLSPDYAFGNRGAV